MLLVSFVLFPRLKSGVAQRQQQTIQFATGSDRHYGDRHAEVLIISCVSTAQTGHTNVTHNLNIENLIIKI